MPAMSTVLQLLPGRRDCGFNHWIAPCPVVMNGESHSVIVTCDGPDWAPAHFECMAGHSEEDILTKIGLQAPGPRLRVVAPMESVGPLAASWDDYMAEVYPEIPSLWGGRYTPLLVKGGSYLILSADTGIGKTILLSNLMLMMADGRDQFLGFSLPGRPVRQLLLEAEGSRPLFRDRMQAVAAKLGIQSPPIFFRKAGDELTIERVGNMIADCKVEHAFLDPIGKFHDADENSNTEWRRHVNMPLQRLSEELDVAISYADHYSKPNENRSGQHKVKGAAAKVQDSQVAMRLEIGAAGYGSLTLFFDRIRDGALPFPDRDPSRMPLLIDRAAGTIAVDERDDADLGTTVSARLADVGRLTRILAATSPKGRVGTAMLRLRIQSELGVGRSQAEALIKSAKEAGVIRPGRRGEYRGNDPSPDALPLGEEEGKP